MARSAGFASSRTAPKSVSRVSLGVLATRWSPRAAHSCWVMCWPRAGGGWPPRRRGVPAGPPGARRGRPRGCRVRRRPAVGLPGGDRGVQPGQGGRDALVLGLHAQDDVGLQIDPGEQQRPQQLVLALVMVVQAQPVVAEVVGDHRGARGVTRGDRRDELHEQPRFAAEDAVDDLHVLGVDAHLFLPFIGLRRVQTAPGCLEGTWSRLGTTGRTYDVRVMVLIRVLGSFAAEVGGEPVHLGGPRQRGVLALLVAARGQVVPVDRMIEDLWRGEPPARALASLQAYVSNLRRLLEPGRPPRTPARLLVSAAPGYALRLPPEAVDAWRFEDLLDQARAARRPARRPGPARRGARAVAGTGVRRGGRRAVGRRGDGPADELRLVARELRVAAGLRLGDPADGGARGGAAHPRRAPARGGLAAARPGAVEQRPPGRRAGGAPPRPRASSPTELGLDPGPDLAALEEAILTQRTDVLRAAVPRAQCDAPRSRSPRRRRARPGRRGAVRRARGASCRHWSRPPARPPPTGRASPWSPARRGSASRRCSSTSAGGSSRTGGWSPSAAAPRWTARRPRGPGSRRCERVAASVPAGEFAADLAPLLTDAAPVERSTRPPDGSDCAKPCGPGSRRPPPDRPVAVVLDDLHWADADTLELLGGGVELRAPVLVVAAYRADESGHLTETLAVARPRRAAAARPCPGWTTQAVARARPGRVRGRRRDRGRNRRADRRQPVLCAGERPAAERRGRAGRALRGARRAYGTCCGAGSHGCPRPACPCCGWPRSPAGRARWTCSWTPPTPTRTACWTRWTPASSPGCSSEPGPGPGPVRPRARPGHARRRRQPAAGHPDARPDRRRPGSAPATIAGARPPLRAARGSPRRPSATACGPPSWPRPLRPRRGGRSPHRRASTGLDRDPERAHRPARQAAAGAGAGRRGRGRARDPRGRPWSTPSPSGRDDLMIAAFTAWTEPTPWQARAYGTVDRPIVDTAEPPARATDLAPADAVPAPRRLHPRAGRRGRSDRPGGRRARRSTSPPPAPPAAGGGARRSWSATTAAVPERDELCRELVEIGIEHDLPVYRVTGLLNRASAAAGGQRPGRPCAALIGEALDLARTYRMPEAIGAAEMRAGDAGAHRGPVRRRRTALHRGRRRHAARRIAARRRLPPASHWPRSGVNNGTLGEHLEDVRAFHEALGPIVADLLALALHANGLIDEARRVRTSPSPIRPDFFFTFLTTLRAMAVIALDDRDAAEEIYATLLAAPRRPPAGRHEPVAGAAPGRPHARRAGRPPGPRRRGRRPLRPGGRHRRPWNALIGPPRPEHAPIVFSASKFRPRRNAESKIGVGCISPPRPAFQVSSKCFPKPREQSRPHQKRTDRGAKP